MRPQSKARKLDGEGEKQGFRDMKGKGDGKGHMNKYTDISALYALRP